MEFVEANDEIDALLEEIATLKEQLQNTYLRHAAYQQRVHGMKEDPEEFFKK